MVQFSPSHSVGIGEFRVTFLADGGGRVNPLASFPASTAEGWERHPELLDQGIFVTSIGGFVIETGDHKIVVDAGIGPQTVDFPGFGPFSGGRFLDSLEATGVAPESVTQLVFTHLHLDHCGWVSQESEGRRQLIFPNARCRVTAAEWDFWYGGDNPAGPDPIQAQAPLAERIETFQEGDAIVPGLTVLETPGHSPGHISLLLESQGERLYLLGDLIHSSAQLAEPDWSIAFDVDAAAARKSRERLLDLAERSGDMVAANHFPDQVFGRILRQGGQRLWAPLD